MKDWELAALAVGGFYLLGGTGDNPVKKVVDSAVAQVGGGVAQAIVGAPAQFLGGYLGMGPVIGQDIYTAEKRSGLLNVAASFGSGIRDLIMATPPFSFAKWF